MERQILHVDVNNAFLSWTAVEMLKNGSQIDIREIPSIIGGDESKRSGIVLAKSPKAKEFGIKTAETIYQARMKCPSVKIYKSDFKVYQKYSNMLYKLLQEYTDKIERFSIDECFLDMTNYLMKRTLIEVAQEIHVRVKNELGFTVNIGVANNKLLAKMASDFEKPDKVHTLFPEEIPVKMWPLPVRDLLFLGKSSEKKLKEAGIRTIGDLAHEKKPKIQALLGEKAGQQLYRYARGLDDSPVKMKPDEAKGFSLETTFNDDLVSMEQALPILLEQCDVLAARMRRKKKKCTCISVTFRTLDFQNRSHQMKLKNATDITDEIYFHARKLFEESWRGQPLRLLGVSLTGLTDDSFEQLSFFEDTREKERRQKLDAALDSIRLKYGNDKVTRASIMNSTARIGRKAKAQMENEREQ